MEDSLTEEDFGVVSNPNRKRKCEVDLERQLMTKVVKRDTSGKNYKPVLSNLTGNGAFPPLVPLQNSGKAANQVIILRPTNNLGDPLDSSAEQMAPIILIPPPGQASFLPGTIPTSTGNIPAVTGQVISSHVMSPTNTQTSPASEAPYTVQTLPQASPASVPTVQIVPQACLESETTSPTVQIDPQTSQESDASPTIQIVPQESTPAVHIVPPTSEASTIQFVPQTLSNTVQFVPLTSQESDTSPQIQTSQISSDTAQIVSLTSQESIVPPTIEVPQEASDRTHIIEILPFKKPKAKPKAKPKPVVTLKLPQPGEASECPTCSDKFDEPLTYLDHVKECMKHTGSKKKKPKKPINTKIPKPEQTSKKKKNPAVLQQGKSKICDECGRQFSRPSNIVRHKAKGCTGGMPKDVGACEICGATFKGMKSFRKHMQSKTCKIDRLKCHTDHQHIWLEETFDTFEEAKDFIFSNRIDSTFNVKRNRFLTPEEQKMPRHVIMSFDCKSLSRERVRAPKIKKENQTQRPSEDQAQSTNEDQAQSTSGDHAQSASGDQAQKTSGDQTQTPNGQKIIRKRIHNANSCRSLIRIVRTKLQGQISYYIKGCVRHNHEIHPKLDTKLTRQDEVEIKELLLQGLQPREIVKRMNVNRSTNAIGDLLKTIGPDDVGTVQFRNKLPAPNANVSNSEFMLSIHAERTLDRTLRAAKKLEEVLSEVDPLKDKEWVKTIFGNLMDMIRQKRPGTVIPRFPGSKKDLERQEKERQQRQERGEERVQNRHVKQETVTIFRPRINETEEAVANLQMETERMDQR